MDKRRLFDSDSGTINKHANQRFCHIQRLHRGIIRIVVDDGQDFTIGSLRRRIKLHHIDKSMLGL